MIVYMSVMFSKCTSKGFIVSSIMGITAFLITNLINELISSFINYLIIDLNLSAILYQLIPFGAGIISIGIFATVTGYLLENKVNL